MRNHPIACVLVEALLVGTMWAGWVALVAALGGI